MKFISTLIGFVFACFTFAILANLTAIFLGPHYSEPWIFVVNLGIPVCIWIGMSVYVERNW